MAQYSRRLTPNTVAKSGKEYGYSKMDAMLVRFRLPVALFSPGGKRQCERFLGQEHNTMSTAMEASASITDHCTCHSAKQSMHYIHGGL